MTCNYDLDICGTQDIVLKNSHDVNLSESPQETFCRYNLFIAEENSPSDLKITVRELESARLDVVEKVSKYGFNLLKNITNSGSTVLNVPRTKQIIILVIPNSYSHGLVDFTVATKPLESSSSVTKIILISVGTTVLC